MFIIFWRISKRSQKREIPLGDLGVFMFTFMFSYRYIARCPLPGTCVDAIVLGCMYALASESRCILLKFRKS